MRAAQVSRLRRLPRDTTLDQRIQDRHKPAEHDLQPPEVEGQGAPVPERPERGLQALPVAGEPRDLEQIPAEMAGVPFELVLHPLGADTLAPPDLEPRAGDRRVHRRLVHALRRVPELLDHQGAVAGLEPVGGEHRIQDHAAARAEHSRALPQSPRAIVEARHGVAAPHQVTGAVGERQRLDVGADQRDPLGRSVTGVEGPALGQPAEDEVDADHPAAVALRQRVRVPAVAAAGVQDELAGTKAQPAGRLQEHVRRARLEAALQQLVAVGGPALAGVQVRHGLAGGRVGHAAKVGRAAGEGRASSAQGRDQGFNGTVMKGVSTTVIALVGERSAACLEAPYRAAKGMHAPYLVHDADALGVVADAWVRRFDQQGPVGELEVAVSETLARWRADTIDLPDYYLVLDSDSWDATRRHWYLGVLHRSAPSRVVPSSGDPAEVEARLAQLSSGPWWPPLDQLLDSVDRLVPDQL